MANMIDICGIKERENEINWEVFSKAGLPDEIILAFPHKIHWAILARSQKLSAKVIEKHADNIGWDILLLTQQIPENVMRENIHNLNWEYVSQHQKLSKEFAREFSNRLNWTIMRLTQKHLGEDFFNEFIYK